MVVRRKRRGEEEEGGGRVEKEEEEGERKEKEEWSEMLCKIMTQELLTIVNQCSPCAVGHSPITESGHTGVEPLLVIADPVQYQDTGTRIRQSTHNCHISHPYSPTSEESWLHHH